MRRLAVRLNGQGISRYVKVKDLEFSRTARGGFESATFSLPERLDATDAELSPSARVTVFDPRNAGVAWQGYLDLPGKTAARQGQTWQVGALGAQTVLTDRKRAFIGIDATYAAWEQGTASKAQMTAGPGKVPGTETDCVLAQIPRGIAVAAGSLVAAKYNGIARSGQVLGAIAYTVATGISDSNYRTIYRVTGDAVAQTLDVHIFNTGNVGVTGEVSTDFTGAHNAVELIAQRNAAATNVADDDHWASFVNTVVQAQRRDVNGAYITSLNAYANPYVLAHQVVVDALNWFTSLIDIAGASIDTSFTHQIDQLAYPDGIRMADLLSDLALLEEIVWEVLEVNASRKHQFNLRRWPTDVRYEASTVDGWQGPGGEVDLANSLTIFWTDAAGKQQSKTYTTNVPALAQWGRDRDAESIDLGSEIGSEAAADVIGPALLANLNTVTSAGTLVVARPIRDRYTGRMVMPWEIEPGYLCNVRDTGDPPMRLTEMSYREADQAASLTLGTPSYSTEEIVSKLARRRNRSGSGAASALSYS